MTIKERGPVPRLVRRGGLRPGGQCETSVPAFGFSTGETPVPTQVKIDAASGSSAPIRPYLHSQNHSRLRKTFVPGPSKLLATSQQHSYAAAYKNMRPTSKIREAALRELAEARVVFKKEVAASPCPAILSRIAVVLSGGGAHGAYEAGALLAFQDAEVPTHILAATSVGAIN